MKCEEEEIVRKGVNDNAVNTTNVEKNLGGRPKKDVDQKAFEELCKIHCNKEEICAVVGVSEKTLTRWCKETYGGLGFSEIFNIKKLTGVVSKRRQFYKSDNPRLMELWLKNYAGVRDKTELESTNKIEVASDVPKV